MSMRVRVLSFSSSTSTSFLTWRLDVQPAGALDLPAQEEVLQARGVGSKHVGERRPLQVDRQRWILGLWRLKNGKRRVTASPLDKAL